MQSTQVIDKKANGSCKHRLPESVKPFIPALTRTNPVVSCAFAGVNLMVLVVVAVILAMVPWGRWLYPLLVLVAVRSLRALENLGGHEGSHMNWDRTNRKLNDLLANRLAAYWVFQSAESVRKTHMPHHRNFSGTSDPCLARFAMLGLAAARRQGFAHFLVELARRYPAYVKQYWIGYNSVTSWQILQATVQHGAAMIIGTFLVPGFWVAWLAGVLLPFAFVLPYFRLFAESEEHSYDGLPEADDTFDNGSLFSRWFLHPVGDARHWCHHILPSIPHWKMERAHLLFLKHDLVYRDTTKRR